MKFEKKLFLIISLLTLVFSIISQAKGDRLKDLVSFAGIRNSISVIKALCLVNNVDYYCYNSQDFKEIKKVEYENIPNLCDKFNIKKNLINPVYLS